MDTIINNCPENAEMPFFIRKTSTGIKVTTGIQQNTIEIHMAERDENPMVDFSVSKEDLESLIDNKILVTMENEIFESTVYKVNNGDLSTLYYSGNISILPALVLQVAEELYGTLISDDTKPFVILNIVNEDPSATCVCSCKTDDSSLEPKIFFGLREDKQEIVKLDPIYLPDNIKLPTITPDTDEGKFLRVISGVAAWSSISNAEEASF